MGSGNRSRSVRDSQRADVFDRGHRIHERRRRAPTAGAAPEIFPEQTTQANQSNRDRCCGAALMPNATAATRNREIYTPVSAVLKHAGFDFKIRRPKGWRGRIIRRWLWPEQAWRVIDGAYRIDAELGILCVMLLFGGLRISEQLAMVCDDVQLGEAFAFVPDSKNGEPQPVHL